MKKVLIISSSPRRKGNSETLCQQFAKGSMERHYQVEMINLNDYKIAPCLGCEACRHINNQCFQKDDANVVISKMIEADVWVLSTPVYFYGMTGQMKLLIDRMFAREFEIRESSKRRSVYYIVTSGTPDKDNLVGTIESLRGFIKVLRTIDEGGIIYGTGAFLKGDALHHPSFHEAYKMAKALPLGDNNG